MKAKKIITAASCAALIAAAALPLTACGGAKSLQKTDLNIKDYAVAYESTNSYSLEAPSRVRSVTGKFTDASTSGKFVITCDHSDGDDSFSYYNMLTGNAVVKDVTSYASVVDYRFVRVTVNSDGEQTYSLYGEDGTKLYDGGDYSYFGITEKKFFVGKDEEESDVLVVTNGYYNDDDATYFTYEEEDDVRSYSKVEKSALKYYSPEYEVGSNIFDGTESLAHYYAEKETGAAAAYSLKNVGNELVFIKDGAETGRVNADNIESCVFLGDAMLYTKLVELPEGDKSANVIKSLSYSDAYYTYELHSYSYETNKDKKFGNYGIKIDSMAPIYNYNIKSYDAVAIRGCKLDGKTYQYRSAFQYIVTSDLKIGFDATGLSSFTSGSAKIVEVGSGNYAVQTSIGLTPVNNKLEPTGNLPVTGATIKYYEKENLYRVFDSDTRAYGFVDANGKVVIEPIYGSTAYPADGVKFYGGIAYTTNNVTDEKVFLSANGTEKAVPKDDYTDWLNGNFVDVKINDGWYSVMTTTTDEDTGEQTTNLKLFTYDGTTLASYDNVKEFEVLPNSNNKMWQITYDGYEYEGIYIQ